MPSVGHPRGLLSPPNRVYSCSIPNHGLCSFTLSITSLQAYLVFEAATEVESGPLYMLNVIK